MAPLVPTGVDEVGGGFHSGEGVEIGAMGAVGAAGGGSGLDWLLMPTVRAEVGYFCFRM